MSKTSCTRRLLTQPHYTPCWAYSYLQLRTSHYRLHGRGNYNIGTCLLVQRHLAARMWVAQRLMIAVLDVLDELVPLAAAQAVAVCTAAAAAEAWHEIAAAAESSVLEPLGLQTELAGDSAAYCETSHSQGAHTASRCAVYSPGILTIFRQPYRDNAS